MTAALATLAIGSGLLAALLTDRSASASRLFKIIASTAMLLIIPLGSPELNGYTVLVAAALAASWLGDLALSFEGRSAFLAGLFSFALAHVLYIAGFFSRSSMDLFSVVVSAIVMAITAAAILKWLAPYIPEPMGAPVAAYIGIISVMVVTSFGTSGALADPRIPTAAVLFTISDVLVARHQFVQPALANRVVGLPVYFAAQVLFAVSVVVPWT
ncbi:MAG: lysoplasmalogenase [Actinomycetota bacterium]